MSLKNEIFEGITAYKALTPTAQDKYQGEMYKIAKRENDDWEERQRAKQDAIAAGKPQTPGVAPQVQANVPTMSRSDTIGSGPEITRTASTPVEPTVFRRGGRVRRFEGGGFLGGLASGIKSTFQAPRAIDVNQWAPRPEARDAGIPGSDDAAVNAAVRYGRAPTPAVDYGGSTGGTEGTSGTGGSATDGSGSSAAAGVGGDDGGTYRRGGRVRGRKAIRTNYRAGGAVTPHDDSDDDDEMATTEPVYRPSEDPRPLMQREWRPEAKERPPRERDRDWPNTDTDEEGGTYQGEGRYEGEPAQPDAPPPRYQWGPNYQRGGSVKAFDDGGVASAFRGGRPEYNPDEDPDVQEKNRADAIIREVISSQVGEPDHFDPSQQIMERGEADREARRSKSNTLPSFGPPVGPEDAAASRASYAASGTPLPPIPPKPPAPDRAGPTPAAATRAELEAKYRSEIPEPPSPEEGDPAVEINERGEQDRWERRQDDSNLTDYAPDPYRPPSTPAEKEDPANYRRPYRPNIGPPQALETQVPPADAAYPATAPGELTKPKSAAREFIDRNLPHVIPGDRKSTGDEAAADRRWQESINQRRYELRTNPLEKITPEERERRRAELAKLDAEEAAGSPSERLRARRRAIETGTPASAFADKEPAPVGPIQAAVADVGMPKIPGVNAPFMQSQRDAAAAAQPPAATPAAPGKTTPAATAPAAPAAPAAPRPAGAGDPSVYGPVVQRPADDPDYLGASPVIGQQMGEGEVYGPPAPADPRAPLARPSPNEPLGPPAPGSVSGRPAPATAQRGGGGGGGGGGGTNTAGGSPGATTAAPPPGAADANRPSTAEKPETRVAAYDPTVDRADPSTGRTMPRQLDAQGRAIATGPPPVAQGDGGPPGSPATGQITRTSSTQTYGNAPGSLASATGFNNTDIAQTLNGAGTLVRPGVNGGPPPIGHLAASRPALNAYVDHHSQNGRFTPGEAILVGMVSDYKMLLKQGRIKQANEMAYGLLQAANLEAASHGMVARDKMAAGDYRGAAESMVTGLNYIVDGVSQRLSADGQYMESFDPRTNQVTARTPLDGRLILAGIMGLSDGTLFWKTLQASAAHLQKPDTGAEGRQLSNDLRRRQIALADKRLSAPTGRARTGATTSGGMSGFQRDLARIRGERPEHSGGGGGGGGTDTSYGDDLAVINLDTRDDDG